MHIPEYIHNIEEAIRFCERYGISCSVVDNQLSITEPPLSYINQFKAMESAAQKLESFVVDHPNCFLNNQGRLIATFSPYDGELREEEQKKLKRKGYDLRLCDYDLYGHGTKTYVMAELVSPLD